MIRKILVSVYHLHDVPKIHLKCDNDRSGSFGDYSSNKNRPGHGTFKKQPTKNDSNNNLVIFN